MGRYVGRQTGHTSQRNPWLRDNDKGRPGKAEERHSGDPHVGLEVEIEGSGSVGTCIYRRREERRLEEPSIKEAPTLE